MESKVAQFTLRGDVAHFQVGSAGSYDKYDIPATNELREYYEAAVEDGDSVNSLAGSSTQYAVVEFSTTPRVEFVMSKHVVIDLK